MTTIPNELNETLCSRPHVVILGAGASRATCRNGDANGNKLPLFNDLISIIGLNDLLSSHGIPYGNRNFEELYSDLFECGRYSTLVQEIEAEIRRYFSNLALPDVPTIYDHLVLSLRPKDLIASFNWDPLLAQAAIRKHDKTKLPQIAFLHGNVALGYCETDRRQGPQGTPCHVCGQLYQPSNLLHPIKKKNYQSDPVIRAEWETLQHYLENAFMLTIFGYGAPTTDVEAIEILKLAWERNRSRELAEIEIINTAAIDDLRSAWKDFIVSDHYRITDKYCTSWIANHPRRSCEAMLSETQEINWNLNDNRIPPNLNLHELQQWYQPLLDAERS